MPQMVAQLERQLRDDWTAASDRESLSEDRRRVAEARADQEDKRSRAALESAAQWKSRCHAAEQSSSQWEKEARAAKTVASSANDSARRTEDRLKLCEREREAAHERADELQAQSRDALAGAVDAVIMLRVQFERHEGALGGVRIAADLSRCVRTGCRPALAL